VISLLANRAGHTALLALFVAMLVAFPPALLAQPQDLQVIDGSELIIIDDIPPDMQERGVIRLGLLTLPADFFASPPDPGVSEPVVIDIDEDSPVALMEKMRRERGERVYIFGEVDDEPYSQFIFVQEEGIIDRGEIRIHNEVIFLTTTEVNASSIIMQMIVVDPSTVPPELEPAAPSGFPDIPPPPPEPEDESADTTTIHVLKLLVVYTGAAKTWLESFFNGQRTIEEAIDDTVFARNFVFRVHGELELELVHMQQVNYKETGDITVDLERLGCPCDHHQKGIGDNHLNEVFEPWKEHEADIVSLWVNYWSQPGYANIMRDVSTDFAPAAVSVVGWQAAITNYSFIHEIGHNFGARHHWDFDDTDMAPYAFNHGGWNQPAEKVTIMTYPHICAPPAVCDRVAVWSNPDYPPLGSWGTATGPEPEDNAQALRVSAYTMSQLFEQGKDWIGCCKKSGWFLHRKYSPGKCD